MDAGNNSPAREPWRVSLHGGHSSRYCDHAQSTLSELVEAACAQGMTLFGVTEHAPRVEPERLYDEEIELGWTVDTLDRLFTEYAAEVDAIKGEYAGRLTILKGFEAETVPTDRYAAVMNGYRERLGFDYIVGSAHYVAGHIIDYIPGRYQRAVEACGGPEHTAVRYFETLAEMVAALRPEVVGHFDLIRKQYADDDALYTPPVRRAALDALAVIREQDTIMDVNTGGLRKGLGHPYPAPWVVEAARDMGIAFCFGDDSHNVGQVGAGLDASRIYLLSHGVTEIEILEPGAAGLNRRRVPLG